MEEKVAAFAAPPPADPESGVPAAAGGGDGGVDIPVALPVDGDELVMAKAEEGEFPIAHGGG